MSTPTLVPLAVGNQWLYGGWYVKPSISDSFLTIIDRQIPATNAATPTYRQVSYSVHSQVPTYGWLFSNQSDGLHLGGGLADSDTLLVESLYRRYPTTIGDSWHVINLVFNVSGQTFVIKDTLALSTVAVDSQITTLAGKFKCIVFKYSFKPEEDVVAWWNVYEYYSPEVGMVLQLVKNQVPGHAEIPDTVQITYLCRYHIN